MASIQPRGEKFQLRVRHALLSKPFFWTFPSFDEAKNYGDQLEALLERGIVPIELLSPDKGGTADTGDTMPMVRVLDNFLAHGSPSQSDIDLGLIVRPLLVGVRVSQVTYQWTQTLVKDFKVKTNLAPGTIRKRVGLLARALDYHHLNATGRDQVNPFRLLPRGYSAYTAAESTIVEPKVDVARDRRLLPEEEAAVRLALSGEKREDRERALQVDELFQLFFDLILDTGLRLSEAFKLRVDQFDFEAGVIRVEGSKGHRGKKKPRVVPLKKHLRPRVKKQFEGKKGLAFPFWDGTPEDLRKTSNRLSARFAALFRYAKVEDFTEHDLRHESACRWFELRDPKGRWVFSDVEVCRIMGWSNLSMALRYASIRGEDLASRLE